MTKQQRQNKLRELYETLTVSNLGNIDILKLNHSFFYSYYEIYKIQGYKDVFHLYQYDYDTNKEVRYIDTVNVINKFKEELNKGGLR